MNLFKHPVAQGERTLKSELREFQAEMLAWVKGLSIKQRNQSFRGLSQYRRAAGNSLLKRSKKLLERCASGMEWATVS